MIKTKRKALLVPLYTVLFIAVIFIIGSGVYNKSRAYPLGDKLEYIGKTTSGSWLPMSSMSPTDTYYYGSDMPAAQLVPYFNKASLIGEIRDTSDYSVLDLQTPDKKTVTIHLYKDRNSNQSSHIPAQFEKTSKRYLITIYDFDYEALKKSL